MGTETTIAWCDHTFNPWIGCTKVSDGCRHCYAEAQDRRWNKGRWGPSAARTRTSAANWKLPLRWNRDAQAAGVRRRVFCASLADVFDDHPSILPAWRRDLFGLIDETPGLDWLLLTKRPEHIARVTGSVPPNVWLGTTVENQEQADRRIPHLLAAPARVRFLSCEPLLGPVSLRSYFANGGDVHPEFVDWVIVGGESGPGARAFDLGWARSIRDQCAAASVPCFVKQLGARPCVERDWQRAPACDCEGRHGSWCDFADGPRWLSLGDRKGGNPAEWPEDLRIQRFPEAQQP